MKNIKIIVTVIVTICVSGFVVSSSAAAFDPIYNPCQQPGASTSSACSSDQASGSSIPVVGDVIDVISLAAGIAAIIMIIIASIEFITSGGEPQKVASARNSILGAFVGLVIVVISQAIVHFIIYRAYNGSIFVGYHASFVRLIIARGW
jgi:hypothetical protein